MNREEQIKHWELSEVKSNVEKIPVIDGQETVNSKQLLIKT